MSKISLLDPIEEPTGEETVVVLADGVAKRVPMAPLASAALAPHVVAANETIDGKVDEATAQAAIAASAAASLTPFLVAPATNHVLYRVKNPIRLRKYVGIVAVNWPAGLCVREAARDSPGSGHRYRLRVGSWNGSAYTDDVLAETTNQAFLNAAGKTGKLAVDLYFRAGHPDVVAGLIPSGTWAGSLPYDFGAGEQHGTYATLKYDFAVGGLDPLRVLPDTTALADAVNAVKADAATTISSPVFARPVANAVAKDILARRHLEVVELDGVKPGHNYQVSYLKADATMFEIRFMDEVSGRNVGRAWIADPDYNAMPEYLRIRIESNATGGPPYGGYTGISGRVKVRNGVGPTTGTFLWTAGEDGSRLSSSCLMTFDQVATKFEEYKRLARENPAAMVGEVIKVTPTGTGALMTAIRSTYEDAVTDDLDIIKVHWCRRASPRRPVIIDMSEGEFFASNAFLPDWVFLRSLHGEGEVDASGNWLGYGTLVRCRDTTMPRPPIQGHMNNIAVGFSIYCDSTALLYGGPLVGQYAWHADINNGYTLPDFEGVVNFQYNLYLNLRIIGGPSNQVQGFGGGLSNPGFVDLDLRMRRQNTTSTQPYVASHTCANASDRKGKFRVKLTILDRPPGSTVAEIAVQSEQAWQVPMELVVDQSPSVRRVGYSGAVDGGWTFSGTYDGAVYSSAANVLPSFANTARLLNNSGVTIPKTTVCATVGNVAAPLADGGVADAVAAFDVPAGQVGTFIVSRQLDARQVIAGVTNAMLYVNNGVATTTPQLSGVPIGRVKDGILTLAGR